MQSRISDSGSDVSATQMSLAGEEIEDWDFSGVNTQYATHGMHTWLAAMIPALAKKLIHETQAERVLDPFCGGGSVLVECGLAGVPAKGIEINPLGVTISTAKTTWIPSDKLNDAFDDLMSQVKRDKDTYVRFPESHNIQYWFKPYMFPPLGKLVSAVKRIKDEKIRSFFECVFSATARDVSLTYRNEIRLRKLRPDKLERFNPDVVARFAHRAHDSIRRVQKFPQAKIHVQQGTVLSLPFDDDSFTTIITSPPYGDERNGVPYLQFAKNMLYWLGWTQEEMMKLKGQTLGWMSNNSREFDLPPSPTLRSLVERIKRERTKREAIAFYSDFYRALAEMIRVTSKRIAIVIGQRVLEKKVFDNSKITSDLMKSLGVPLKSVYERNLPSKRLPKMREYGASIDKERIMIFEVSSKA